MNRRTALAGLLALAGCGARPAALPSALTGAGPDPARATVSGADGTPLALSRWAAKGAPRAVILALHGFGESGPNTFGWAARAWSEAGLATYAYDQRGFGANPSRRYWPGAEALVADAVAVSGQIRARHPDLPLVIVGHSMGGGIVLAAAAQGAGVGGLTGDALVLAAPAIAGGAQMSPLYRVGGWSLGTFAPDRRFTGGDAVTLVPTDNRAALARAAADSHHFADASGRELWGLVRVSDLAARAAPRVERPVLTLMGAKDDYVRAARVKAVHDTIPGPSRFVLYPDGWHWLFRDVQAPRVWADIADFATDLPSLR
mgnify:FL=1